MALLSAALSLILALLGGTLLYSGVCLFRNYLRALKFGLPIRILLIDHVNPFWLVVDRKVVSLVKRLPFGLGNNSFTRYSFRGWEVPDRYSSHHEMGDAYVLVSYGYIWLYLADPDLVSDILRRANEFPRDTSVTAILDVFGPNISTVSTRKLTVIYRPWSSRTHAAQGTQWQKHRRITASSFNDQNNVIVWSESVTVAHDILKYWTSKPAIQTTADDLRTLSLHVMSRAGFGRSSKFQSQEESEAAESSGGMSYQNALKMILENCVLIFALGRKTLAHSWLPRKLQRLDKACISFQNHMTQVYEEEKRFVAEGKKTDRNFMASLIYGNMFTFNFAGHDTTAHTFTFALYFLAVNPGVQDWVCEEINHVMGQRPPEEWTSSDSTRLKRCLAVMYETLRLYTPVPTSKIIDGNLPRSLVIGNKTLVLPPKTMVVPSYSSMQTDPKYWGTDSLEWRPSRFISSPTQSGTSAQALDGEEFITPRKGIFLAWSGGPRDCVGRKFSQVEFVAVMASLFREWRVKPVLAEGETAEDARERVLDQIETDSAPVLLLQMLHPERCPLTWEKR
ncbi:hypothetical protein KVR01_008834 [Diaporthe batatas]|uniref:uncharacterized protein n=1 Tax=Diaporthe batatas TaxID=748121 RepID=UPI001D038BC7|nr:uncharacterized protein KVR01_008834 [Diaporthe batatas]KAG8161847.1 hypothetical protein KVR01_008834 [Diaporthe batatas]